MCVYIYIYVCIVFNRLMLRALNIAYGLTDLLTVDIGKRGKHLERGMPYKFGCSDRTLPEIG